MRTLISALAAAGVLAFALPGYSADEPYTAKPGVEKPGRPHKRLKNVDRS